jgi:CRISPR-associated endonuclease Csn1
MDKHANGIYSRRPNPVGETLKLARDQFVNLNDERQMYVLRQILNLSLICNSANADLRDLGTLKTGVMKISKQLSGCKEFKLINYSVTGLYKNEVDLLTV